MSGITGAIGSSFTSETPQLADVQKVFATSCFERDLEAYQFSPHFEYAHIHLGSYLRGGGNESQYSLQAQRPFFVSRVHDKFGRFVECAATDVLVVLVVLVVGGGHVAAIVPVWLLGSRARVNNAGVRTRARTQN